MLGKNLEVTLPTDEDQQAQGATKQLKVLKCWASGSEVLFDPEAHAYSTGDGHPWLSGSAFADKFISQFDSELIAGKSASKHGVEATDLLDMWALNAQVSRDFGTSLHGALQLRGEYAQLSRAVKDGALDAALTKNPVLRPIVEAFFDAERDEEIAAYEVFVADPVGHRCGQIDRLVVDADGVFIEDYKTNTDLSKRETIKPPFKGLVPNTQLGAYWLQLSFYAHILQSHGKNVKGLRVHYWTGAEWITYSSQVIDITEGLSF